MESLREVMGRMETGLISEGRGQGAPRRFAVFRTEKNWWYGVLNYPPLSRNTELTQIKFDLAQQEFQKNEAERLEMMEGI